MTLTFFMVYYERIKGGYSMAKRDYYEVLGVSKQQLIKKLSALTVS